ncbi:MAG: hypothetical protein NTW94_05620 [Legionellales bacterium]|nr:hypothetical protein [Legionellales bacterium]
MVDHEKAARFKAYFTQWRGDELALKEEPILASAMAISQLIDTSTFCPDRRKLFMGESAFNGFEDDHLHRPFGAILLAILSLKEYHHQCLDGGSFAEGEQELLQALLANLESVYQDPTHHPVDKFKAFISLTFRWLTEGIINNPNLNLAKNTLILYFAILTGVESKLNRLSYPEQIALRAMFIGQKPPKPEISALITEAASKLVELETIRSPLDIMEIDEPPTTTAMLSVDNYFDTSHLNLFTADLPLPEKFEQLKTHLIRIRAIISALMTEKTNDESLQIQIKHSLQVLHAIDTNESKLVRKQSLRELIHQNRDSIDVLVSHASALGQREWSIQLNELTSRSAHQQAADMVFSLLSWVTWFPTAAIKVVTPKSVQDWVILHMPTTSEGDIQSKLRNLAVTRLHTLQNTLASSTGKKARIIHPLAEDSPSIKALLLQATTHQLQGLLDKNLKINQLFIDYETFSTTIIQNRKRLRVVEGLNTQIDEFIQNHNTFFVRLSLYVSNLCSLFSIFKTEMAAKIEDIEKMSVELQTLKSRYEQTVTTNIASIMQHPSASLRIKRTMLDLIPSETRVAKTPVIKDTLTAFSLVKTTFHRLKTTQLSSGHVDTFDVRL